HAKYRTLKRNERSEYLFGLWVVHSKRIQHIVYALNLHIVLGAVDSIRPAAQLQETVHNVGRHSRKSEQHIPRSPRKIDTLAGIHSQIFVPTGHRGEFL